MKTQIKILFFSFIPLIFNSCISFDELINYKQDFPGNIEINIDNPPEIRIQPDDVLDIKVHSQDLETAAPFNLVPAVNGARDIQSLELTGYLVDKSGSIDFPVIGKINLLNLTIPEAKTQIMDDLQYFLKNPVVNIRLVNFRITVSGEVNLPGSFVIYDERVTVPEILSFAGDMTSYADRSNILIVRETNGKRSFNKVNMLSSNIFNSEFYYLRQNDLVYVEPLKEKTGAIGDQSNETLGFVTAGASLLAIIVALFK